MPQWLVTDVSIILPSVTLTVMLAFFALTDAYIGRDHRKVLLIICALMLCLIAQNYCDMLLQGRFENISLRTVVSVIGYILRPVILALFCYVVNPKGRFYFAWTLVAVNGAVYLTAFFSHLTFWISESNRFREGPLRYTCHAVSAMLLFYLLFLSVRKFRSAGARNNWVPLLAAFLIVGSVVMDNLTGKSEQPVAFLTMAIVLSGSFYYVWLHLQFVRTRERELLAGQRVLPAAEDLPLLRLGDGVAPGEDLQRAHGVQGRGAPGKPSPPFPQVSPIGRQQHGGGVVQAEPPVRHIGARVRQHPPFPQPPQPVLPGIHPAQEG